MGDLKPKVVDRFRLHRGEIFRDVENSRRFDRPLWERMRRGDTFIFDKDRGKYDVVDTADYEFALCDYLLSKDPGLRLSEILGSDVKIVTQRNLLKNMITYILKPNSIYGPMLIHCERIGNVIFMKQIESPESQEKRNHFIDYRRQFFAGDDLPGCIGSTPVEDFQFPDVGKAYSLLSLQHGDARIVYSCTIHHFSPAHKPVDSTLIYERSNVSYRNMTTMLSKAVTNGYQNQMFFMMYDGKAQVEFRNPDNALRKHPEYQEALRQTLDVILDKRLRDFLSVRRCCTATLEHKPELRLRPSALPYGYKSFLSKEFFSRFFDSDDDSKEDNRSTGDLKPEIVDLFRLHRGEIFRDVENSRRFEQPLWDRMKKRKLFVFHKERGKYDVSDGPDYEFPMCDYLLSQERGLSLSEILGDSVKVVTQRNLLKNLLTHILSPEIVYEPFEIHCERFGNVVFMKMVETVIYPQYFFVDKRRQFFTGSDLPGCVGSTPVEEFRFPDVGKAYSVLSLQHGDARVVYSCTIHHFSPDHEPVDSTMIHNTLYVTQRKLDNMLEKAVTDGFKNHFFFKMDEDTVQMEFQDTDYCLQQQPKYRHALRQALDLLLDKRLLAFLSVRRCCKATLQHDPELRFRPANISRNYKSFLPKEFFLRFFDDDL